MENFQEIKTLIKSDVALALKKIEALQTENPESIELLLLKVNALESIDKMPEALNCVNAILNIDSENQEAIVKRDFLKTILRYRNTDIYACTNLWNDPWFE